MNQDQIKQFESLAKPLMEWLKEHRASGTVVMTSENCQFLKSEITIETSLVISSSIIFSSKK